MSRLRTSQTKHRSSESTTDSAVVRVVLLSQVCGGVLGEHVRSSHSGCASTQSVTHVLFCPVPSLHVSFRIVLRHTENANGAPRAGEDTPRADILLCEGVLDSRDEGAGAAGDQGGLDGVAHGILGVVVVGPLVVFGHCEWRGW